MFHTVKNSQLHPNQQQMGCPPTTSKTMAKLWIVSFSHTKREKPNEQIIALPQIISGTDCRLNTDQPTNTITHFFVPTFYYNWIEENMNIWLGLICYAYAIRLYILVELPFMHIHFRFNPLTSTAYRSEMNVLYWLVCKAGQSSKGDISMGSLVGEPWISTNIRFEIFVVLFSGGEFKVNVRMRLGVKV